MQITKNNMPYNVCIIRKVYMYSKWGISEQALWWLWSLKSWVQFGTHTPKLSNQNKVFINSVFWLAVFLE